MLEPRMNTAYLFSTKQNLVPSEGISSINSFFQLWDFFGSGILGGKQTAWRGAVQETLLRTYAMRSTRKLALLVCFSATHLKKSIKLEIILGAPSFCWQVKIVTLKDI